MNRLSIKYQILFIAFIPTCLITILFTYLQLNLRLNHAQALLQHQGQIISRQIARLYLLPGTEQKMQSILDQIISTDNVIFAAVYNDQDQLIAKSDLAQHSDRQPNNYNAFHQPILSQDKVIGRVQLYLSDNTLDIEQDKIIRDTIVLFIAVFVLALLLAITINHYLSAAIFKFIENLDQTETDLQNKNRELCFARNKAENANRTKTQFLTNMSHEIRTPLNSIKGFIHLMMKSSMTLPQRRYAGIVLKSTNDLTAIIEEILDLSKLESGKLQIVVTHFNLYEVIEEARDILFINIIHKNIDLILIIYSDTPKFVSGDRLRLKQVLLNLIGNAIKFTDDGQVVIRVQLEQISADKAEILIVVEDTGIGITKQAQEKLFTAFEQISSAPNQRYRGTGLGLVISKNLVNMMGGSIGIESDYGVGSKFSIRIPFSVTPEYYQQNTETGSHLSALIFASEAIFLQEIQSLYDRAAVTTEGSLVQPKSVDTIMARIQQNRQLIDIVVFDLRHLSFRLDKLIDKHQLNGLRIIIMHYDQSMLTQLEFDSYEFISVVTTHAQLKTLLSTSPQTNHPDVTRVHQLPPTALTKRVLLVDDNLNNLTLCGALIRLWGHQVIEAGNALNALSHYQKHDFDLIMLDIQMPEIDGIELLKMIRAEKPEDTVPIVALTAQMMHGNVERLMKLGFDDYISKPIDEEKLRDVLNSHTHKIEPLPSIDVKKSLALLANNKLLLKQTFETLLQEIPGYQDQLHTALQPFDQHKIYIAIHKIHGVTCYTSLPKIRQQIVAIETCLNQNEESDITARVKAIIEELSCIQSALLTHQTP